MTNDKADKAENDLEKIKQELYGEVPIGSNEPKWELGLSTGSYLLNLACSGRIDVGFAPDFYYVWAGRSGSGKSFVNLAALAEASINPAFKSHRLIYDAPETGALMSFERFYGPEMARRVEPPAGKRESPIHSKTLEGFYHNVFNAISIGPCVYLLDSMDALPTDDEWRDFEKKNKDRDDEGEIPKRETGSYHTERARCNAHHLRLLYNKLQGSNSILIVIFQSRENIGFGSQFNPDTRGGGTAPTFFAGLELWSKVASHLHTNYKGNKVEQGVVCEVRVKKGRLTGKDRKVDIPIYHSFGIDNIGGMIDFLVEWGRWKRTGKERGDVQSGKITAPDFDIDGWSREDVVHYVIEKDFEKDLMLIVQETWNDIEEVCAVERKSRYHGS